MTIFASVTSTPILKNSKNVNVLTFLDSATSIIIMLLAAHNIVRFPAIVLATSSIDLCVRHLQTHYLASQNYTIQQRENYLVFDLIEY